MELWYPPTDRPHLFEWWRPLVLASREARRARLPWPLPVDEMVLRGRVERAGRPRVWVYRHPEAGELYLDDTGQAYRFTRTPRAKGFGRFTCCDIAEAMWRAGIPSVVEPIVWARRDEAPPLVDPHVGDDPVPVAEPGGAVPLHAGARARHAADGGRAAAPAGAHVERPPRRHGHLTVIDGGRSLAG